MLPDSNWLPGSQCDGRITRIRHCQQVSFLLALAIMVCSCTAADDARRTRTVNTAIRTAVFDTTFILPDTSRIIFGVTDADTTLRDTAVELGNGTRVGIHIRWVSGPMDTLMQYIRVDSGIREYSVVRNDTVFHETSIYVPGLRIDTLTYRNTSLEIQTTYGNTAKTFTITRRQLYLDSRRRIPGILFNPGMPECMVTWNNRWLVFRINLNENAPVAGPLWGLLAADLNTGSLHLLTRHVGISRHSLVPNTNTTGTWLHTGQAVWGDPDHPFPMPARMAQCLPDACWTSDSSFVLLVNAPEKPYVVYFSYISGNWRQTDSTILALPAGKELALCPDYNHDLVWVLCDNDSMVSVGFTESVAPSMVRLQAVTQSDWDALMLPVLQFNGRMERHRFRLDLRSGIAYLVSPP